MARTGTLLKMMHWKTTVSSAMSATLAWKERTTQVMTMERWTVTRVQEVKNPIVFLERLGWPEYHVIGSLNCYAFLASDFPFRLQFGGVVSISPVIVRDPGRLVESERRRRQGYDEDLVQVAAPHTKVRWNVLNLAVEPAGVLCRLNNDGDYYPTNVFAYLTARLGTTLS